MANMTAIKHWTSANGIADIITITTGKSSRYYTGVVLLEPKVTINCHSSSTCKVLFSNIMYVADC